MIWYLHSGNHYHLPLDICRRKISLIARTFPGEETDDGRPFDAVTQMMRQGLLIIVNSNEIAFPAYPQKLPHLFSSSALYLGGEIWLVNQSLKDRSRKATLSLRLTPSQ
jgi:hypothetical protein